jgi:hypothetical protein
MVTTTVDNIRKRQCLSCGLQFKTIETVMDADLYTRRERVPGMTPPARSVGRPRKDLSNTKLISQLNPEERDFWRSRGVKVDPDEAATGEDDEHEPS